MTPYELVGFVPCLDDWIALEGPPNAMVQTVTEWIFTRFERPYDGVRRAEGFDNLWYVVVPGTEDDDGQVVVCSYFVIERGHRVQCSSFATLSLPI